MLTGPEQLLTRPGGTVKKTLGNTGFFAYRTNSLSLAEDWVSEKDAGGYAGDPGSGVNFKRKQNRRLILDIDGKENQGKEADLEKPDERFKVSFFVI